MASLSSTKTSLIASEFHLLTGGYVTSYLNLFAVKFLILTLSWFENHFSIITLFFSFLFFFLIIIFFFLNFHLCFVNNLIFLTCQHLPIPISGPCQKFLFPRNFNFTLLGNYIRLLNFLVNPSCTVIDHIVTIDSHKKYITQVILVIAFHPNSASIIFTHRFFKNPASSNQRVRGLLNKFPDFFRMGIFINSTHMKL